MRGEQAGTFSRGGRRALHCIVPLYPQLRSKPSSRAGSRCQRARQSLAAHGRPASASSARSAPALPSVLGRLSRCFQATKVPTSSRLGRRGSSHAGPPTSRRTRATACSPPPAFPPPRPPLALRPPRQHTHAQRPDSLQHGALSTARRLLAPLVHPDRRRVVLDRLPGEGGAQPRSLAHRLVRRPQSQWSLCGRSRAAAGRLAAPRDQGEPRGGCCGARRLARAASRHPRAGRPAQRSAQDRLRLRDGRRPERVALQPVQGARSAAGRRRHSGASPAHSPFLPCPM